MVDNKTGFEKDFLTTTQVAKRCNISRFTVLKWVKQGRIKAIKLLSGHYRIPESEVKSFMSFIKTLSHEHSGKN